MADKYVQNTKAAVFNINQWEMVGKDKANPESFILDAVEFSAKFGSALGKWAEAAEVGKRSKTFSFFLNGRAFKMNFQRVA